MSDALGLTTPIGQPLRVVGADFNPGGDFTQPGHLRIVGLEVWIYVNGSPEKIGLLPLNIIVPHALGSNAMLTEIEVRVHTGTGGSAPMMRQQIR